MVAPVAPAVLRECFLPVDAAIDLPSTLDSGQCFRWRASPLGWSNVQGGVLVSVEEVAGGLLLRSTASDNAAMTAWLHAYLRLDDDILAIRTRLSGHGRVQQGIDAYPGLRLLRQDPWETLAGFILSSTSNIKRISRTMELLGRTAGALLQGGELERHAFPDASTVAELGERRLRALGCGFRAPYLARAAMAVASGELPLLSLRGASYDTIHAALTELVGVGDKIADCVMLFSLDRMEAFPADRWVKRALSEWYGISERATYGDIRAWAQGQFGDVAGYANHFLFWQRRELERQR